MVAHLHVETVRFQRFAAVLMLVAAFLLGAFALPGHAVDPPPRPGGTPPPPTTPTGTQNSGGTVTEQKKSCSVISSPSYLGVRCASGASGGINVAEILGDDEVPECWHEAFTREELDAFGYENSATTTFYWKWCVTGIKKVPNTFDPEFTVEVDTLTLTDPVLVLTGNQSGLMDFALSRGVLPFPIALVSPSAHPRVGQWVSFFNGTDSDVEINTGGVRLRARVQQLTVEPLGQGNGSTVTCPGSGQRVDPGDTRADHPDACWHRYQRSSFDRAGGAFPVWMSAHWQVSVSYDSGATWRLFNEFDKSQITLVPVTEIQTFVVS